MYDLDSRKDIMRLYSDYHQRLTGSYGSERAILAELLEEETITGWHATRVLSADDIAEMGLKAFSREEAFEQFRYLSGVVGLNLGQTETVLQKANHYFAEHPRRTGCVCFYLLKSMAGQYSKYSATLGGETFAWSLEDAVGAEAVEALKSLGVSIRVKFAFSFDRIQPYARGLILSSFIDALSSNSSTDYCLPKIDGAIVGSIPPHDILRIERTS